MKGERVWQVATRREAKRSRIFPAFFRQITEGIDPRTDNLTCEK